MKKAVLSLLILVLGLGVEASAVTVFGVNTANQLIRFTTTLPGTLELQVAITNLQLGENILAIDFRPTNGQLYALGSTGRLYTLNLTTGAAALVAVLSADPSDVTNSFAGLSGTEFGFDFNPVTDRIRVVSDTDQNLRINPDTGAVITDVPLAFAVGDANVGDDPAVTAIAYNNNFPGATTTSLVGVDTFNDVQILLNPSNDGILTTTSPLFLDIEQIGALDIPPGSAQGLLAHTSSSNPSTSFLVNFPVTFCCPFPTATPNAIGGGSRVRSIAVTATSFFRLSASSFSVDEAAGVVNIPIFRFGDTSTSASVNIVTSDGTAIAPFDYVQTNNSIFFNAGDTIRIASISIVNNPIPEPVETFTVSLASPSSNEPITIGTPASATVTITEGSPPPPSQPTPVTVFGVSLGNQLFSFRSNNPFTIDTSVQISGLQPAENVLNIDFRPSNGLLYALGSTGRLYTLDTVTGVATLVAALTADPSDLSNPFASLAGTEFGFDFNPVTDRLRIVSDADVNLDVNPDTATVITDAPLAYDINDPNVGRNPSVVGAAYSNPDIDPGTGTTLYGVDVAFDMLTILNPAANGTLNTVGPTNTNFTERFGFDIAADNTAYFSSTPPGASNSFSTINLNTGSVQFFGGTINFPDVVRDIAVASGSFGILQLSASSFIVNEDDGVVEITVNRVSGSTGTVSVNFSTSPLTASAGADYTTTTGTLTFGPDVTSQSFTVQIIDDTLDEFTEQFNVSLSNPTGGAILAFPTSASVFIVDNDATALPTLSVNDITVAEGNTGSIAVFTVTLSEAVPFAIGVDFITSNGSATAGADYDSVFGFLTFFPGQTTRTITVPIIGDTAAEGDETFFVNLSNPINATIADAQGQGTITDDEGVIATFAFSAPSFGDNEDCGVIPVTVTRTGVTSSAMSVNFATANVTATDRKDYTLAVGTLEFAVGETSKTIPILISEDSFVEGIETLTVNLSSPSAGAGLGPQASTTVLIIDDPSEPATNPIDEAEIFVCQHYHDFLNRDPDPAGLAFWTNEITSCGADAACIDLKRQNVSAAFFLSIEFQNTGFLVERAYQAALNRFPLYLEFIPDTQRIGRGVIIGQPGADALLEANKQAFFNQFVTRPEFIALFGGLTNAQYVDALNANTGGSLSDSERTALVTGLNNATLTRAQVLRSVAEDAEFTDSEFNRAFVLMQYFGYLRRNPNDPPDTNFDGFNFWLNKLNEFNGNFIAAEMVKAFITSIEYRQRFAP